MSIIVPILSTFNAAGIDSASKKFGELDGISAKTGAAFQSAFLPAVAVVGALGVALEGSIKAAIADQAAQEILAKQIVTSTGATAKAIAQNEKWITSQSIATATADEKLRPALASLVRATKDVSKAQELLTLAQDVSAATGKDLEAVSLALAKASLGNVGALTKLGVPLSANTKKTNDFDAATKELSATFAGAASASANTAAGKMKSLGIAMGETSEAIGATFLPILNKLLPILQKVAAWAQENTRVFLIATGVILGTASAIIAVNVAMKAYTAATKVATAAQFIFNSVVKANIFVRLALAVAAVVVAYEAIQTSSRSAGESMATWARRAQLVGGAIIAVFAEVVRVVAAAGYLLVKAGGLFGKVLDPIIGTNIGGKTKEWADAIDRFGQGVTNFQMTAIDFANGKSSEKVESALGGIIDAVKVAEKTFNADPAQSAIANYPADAITAGGTKAEAAAKTAAAKTSAATQKVAAAAIRAAGIATSGVNRSIGMATAETAAVTQKAEAAAKTAAAKAAAATQKAAEALKAKAVQLKATLTSALDKAFGQFSSDALRAYDAETQRLTRGIDANLSAALDGIDRTLTQRIDTIRAKLGETLTGITTEETTLTPAEVAFASAQADRAQILAARDLAAAEKKLAAARKEGDLEAIAEAELHLADMRTETSLKALGELADAERAAARKRADLQRTDAEQAADIAEKAVRDEATSAKTAAENSYNALKTDLDNERTTRREALDLQLADLGEQLDKQPTQYTKIHNVIMGLFKTTFGPDFAQAAADLGQSFADGLLSKESKVADAAARLAQAANPVGGVATPADAMRAAGIATSGANRAASVNLTVNAGIGTNGAQVGQTIVDALNSWTLRNGALPARWIT